MKKIMNALEKLKISSDNFELYGSDIAKINATNFKKLSKKGKLILMTSINPTSAGEGKTTTAIGLVDGLNYIGQNAILALREPSLGPVFGRKGTANGGGESIVLPEDKINLHFTGDIHAITTANNLISAAIDNEIYWESDLRIDPSKIIWKRAIDLNDRSLRNIHEKISKKISRDEEFSITAASNMMTILTLAKDEKDLEERIDSALIAYNIEGKPIFIKDLEITGAILAILNEAIKPNLVLTKYESPTLIHCGPFANISIGTNSIISTNLGLKLADFVVVESGFGSDLGFEKFLNLVNQQADLIPDCVVMVVTLRALDLHNDFENNFRHLEQHLKHVTQYNLHLVVGINFIVGDDLDKLKLLQDWLSKGKFSWAVNEAYTKGPLGAELLAKEVINKTKLTIKYKKLINSDDDIMTKIEKITKNFYYLDQIEITPLARKKIAEIKKTRYFNYPICFVKSQNTIDGNDLNHQDYKMVIQNVDVNTGGKFILVYTNKVFSMPGLNRNPNYKQIKVIDSKVVGLK